MTWEVPDPTEDHLPEGTCSCGAALADATDLGVSRSFHQEEVLAASVQRVEHDLHEVRCACGRAHAAPRRACRIPRSRSARGCGCWQFTWWFSSTCRWSGALPIADVTGAMVSDGFVHSCLGRAASLLKDVIALIRALITASAVAGFDKTTLRSGPAGEEKYVHGGFTERHSPFWLVPAAWTRWKTPGSWSRTATRITPVPANPKSTGDLGLS